MNKKIIISWILVIMWMSIIFIFSNMDTNESNDKSKGTISKVIDETVQTTNGMGITDKHPSDEKINTIVEKLNIPFRKCMHASVYLVLAILLMNALKVSGLINKKTVLVSVLICFIYACTDEFHQTFVEGRTGQFSDVLIDTSGSIIGCGIYVLFSIILIKIKDKKQNNKQFI